MGHSIPMRFPARRLTLSVVLVSFIPPAFAADLHLMEDRRNVERGQSEYFNRNKDQRLEVKVNLIGGVAAPGIYHLPDNTTLLDAISLAGGAVANADLSDVYVKRYTAAGFETFHYDLNEIVANREAKFPPLTDRDTILVKTSNSSQTLAIVLSVIGTAVGVFTAGYLVTRKNR